MTTNKMRAVHPGEILREEYLAPLEMSAHALFGITRTGSTDSRHCSRA